MILNYCVLDYLLIFPLLIIFYLLIYLVSYIFIAFVQFYGMLLQWNYTMTPWPFCEKLGIDTWSYKTNTYTAHNLFFYRTK